MLTLSFFGWHFIWHSFWLLTKPIKQAAPLLILPFWFYLVAMIYMLVTMLFLSVTQVSTFLPMAVWVGVSIVPSLLINRSSSITSTELLVIVLGVLLLEAGICTANQIPFQITNSESVRVSLGVQGYSNVTQQLQQDNQRVKSKISFNRSWRDRGSLTMPSIEADPAKHWDLGEVV